MNNWLSENLIGILGIVLGGFIAYHVYFLSKRIDFRNRLSHKDSIRGVIESILQEIRKGKNSKVELVNAKKYFTHYPSSNEKNRHGYTYLGAELKACRFDGVEFFCAVKEIYRKPDGSLTLNNKSKSNFKREDFNVFEVGLIPYLWIEYVDARGDEFSYRSQIFTRFKGPGKSPYKYLTYYRVNNTYKEGDPLDFKYARVDFGRESFPFTR